MMRAIITDLDGTLIDNDTYSVEVVEPVVRQIRGRGIPICICSSKTRQEIELYRRRLGIRDPFISENGGAVFLEDAVIELGVPYRILVEALLETVEELGGVPLRAFHQLSPEELSEEAALPLEQARLALCREYDEPFRFDGDPALFEVLQERLQQKGFRVTRGGRYHHLTGDHDKGKAVDVLIRNLRSKSSTLFTVGLGDSANDIPMLERVDVAVLVRRPGGQYDEEFVSRLPGVRLTEGVGPWGWKEAVTELFGLDGK